MENAEDIVNAISRLRDGHPLKTAPDSYTRGFSDAALCVYPPKERAKILSEKFDLRDDSKFDQNKFLESAAELTVQNHLKRSTLATQVAIDKQVHPPKDVDAFYTVGPVEVAVEVKCPREKPNADPNKLILKMAGRVPEHLKQYEDLRKAIAESDSGKELVLAQNKDNTFKDFLTLSHGKFSPNSGIDSCNILFVACGYHSNINEWRMHLLQNEGLFTAEPFFPASEFELVDVVILSNLKYFHTAAQQHHDWTLRNVFMLPIINPHGRKNRTRESLFAGLSVFDHHLIAFNRFDPMTTAGDIPDYVMDAIKVGHYVVDHLTDEERRRYFPIKLH